jgi:hypothetical protein
MSSIVTASGHAVGHRQLRRVAVEHGDPGEAIMRAAEVVGVALDAHHDRARGPAWMAAAP